MQEWCGGDWGRLPREWCRTMRIMQVGVHDQPRQNRVHSYVWALQDALSLDKKRTATAHSYMIWYVSESLHMQEWRRGNRGELSLAWRREVRIV